MRSRSARTSFKWVKGHELNYRNIKADELADAGREGDPLVIQDDEEWINNHPALQDGERLQALSTKYMYKALLKWHTRDTTPILHQEILDDAKNRVEAFTSLRPTNERLLKGVKILSVPPRIKDHLRCLLTSKLKCGSFWNRIPGCAERAMCSPCRKRGTVVDHGKRATHVARLRTQQASAGVGDRQESIAQIDRQKMARHLNLSD